MRMSLDSTNCGFYPRLDRRFIDVVWERLGQTISLPDKRKQNCCGNQRDSVSVAKFYSIRLSMLISSIKISSHFAFSICIFLRYNRLETAFTYLVIHNISHFGDFIIKKENHFLVIIISLVGKVTIDLSCLFISHSFISYGSCSFCIIFNLVKSKRKLPIS